MPRCTAPVYGHRTASGAANCPACGSRSYYRSPSYYAPPTRPSWSAGGGSSSGRSSSGGSSSGGSLDGFVEAVPCRTRLLNGERSSPSPARLRSRREHPERRDLFLCHAWDDRQGAARELCDLLVSLGATVWFSEKDVGLGKSLLREIDRGLANSRIGIVLVTPALLKSLAAEGIADKELSALLATDRVIPVAHGTTFEALRDVSPLLAARSGLSTRDSSMRDVATKVAAAAAAEDDT